MENNQNVTPKQPSGSMVNQKTNEDFNKKTPDPADPNEQKEHPETEVPDIGDDEIKPIQGGNLGGQGGTTGGHGGTTGGHGEHPQAPNKSDGKE